MGGRACVLECFGMRTRSSGHLITGGQRRRRRRLDRRSEAAALELGDGEPIDVTLMVAEARPLVTSMCTCVAHAALGLAGAGGQQGLPATRAARVGAHTTRFFWLGWQDSFLQNFELSNEKFQQESCSWECVT